MTARSVCEPTSAPVALTWQRYGAAVTEHSWRLPRKKTIVFRPPAAVALTDTSPEPLSVAGAEAHAIVGFAGAGAGVGQVTVIVAVADAVWLAESDATAASERVEPHAASEPSV